MKLFRSAQRTQLEPTPDREVQIFQSETAEILSGPEPVQAHITMLVLAGLFVSLILVASVMRLDRVVTTTQGESGSTMPGGQIVTVDPTIVLGALDQSLIKSINVHEGQIVEKGDLLATLDPTFTTADVGALKAQVDSLSAEIARCQAELAGKPFTMPLTADPVANSYIAMQQQYFTQRKGQYDAQLAAYNEQIAELKATIAKYQTDAARYGERAKISKEIEDMRATLAAAQVGSRLNLLTATDQKVEIERALEFDHNAVIESQHQLDGAIQTRDAFIQQSLGQISQELVTAQGNLDAANEQLSKATKHEELVHLQAPEASMVLKIAPLSPASVLNAGDPLLYLAPMKSPLEAELRITPRDIGFIRVGDRTTIKLDPFNFVEHGTAEGIVRSISEGAFTTDDNNQATPPYYKVRVKLEPVSLQNVPASFRLVPGMTLTGDIHIGSRSLFMYVMSGILRGVGEAMREP